MLVKEEDVDPDADIDGEEWNPEGWMCLHFVHFHTPARKCAIDQTTLGPLHCLRLLGDQDLSGYTDSMWDWAQEAVDGQPTSAYGPGVHRNRNHNQ